MAKNERATLGELATIGDALDAMVLEQLDGVAKEETDADKEKGTGGSGGEAGGQGSAEDYEKSDDAETKAGSDDGGDSDDSGAKSEAEGEVSGDDESQDEDEKGEETDEDETLSRRVRKRIGKEVRRRKELEERIEALESELEKTRANDGRTAKNETRLRAIDDVMDVEELDQQIEQAWKVRAWATKNPDGAVVKGRDGEQEFDADAVAQMKENAEELLFRDGPRRRAELVEYHRREADMNRQAETLFPWLTDRKHANQKRLEKVLESLPELKRRPGWRMLAATMAHGWADMEARLAAKRDGERKGGEKKLAKEAGTPTRATPRSGSGSGSGLEAARKRALESGDADAVAEYAMKAGLV
jgi:hypothetical protein